jgi:ornithine cyclodeaminase/alanine dehydrogenase-like protein (mu-crystallin family)
MADSEYGPGVCFDPDPDAAGAAAAELGWEVGALDEALACDVVCTVTPGNEPVVRADPLRAGQHLNLLGADGPGKAEAEVAAVERVLREGRLFCDEWEQASHGGELTGAASAGKVSREQVTELGPVCAGLRPGRTDSSEITLFDSTGLAIQDLAIVLGALESVRAGAVKPQTITL